MSRPLVGSALTGLGDTRCLTEEHPPPPVAPLLSPVGNGMGQGGHRARMEQVSGQRQKPGHGLPGPPALPLFPRRPGCCSSCFPSLPSCLLPPNRSPPLLVSLSAQPAPRPARAPSLNLPAGMHLCHCPGTPSCHHTRGHRGCSFCREDLSALP